MIETPRLKNVVIFIQIILLLFSYRKILQKNQQTTLEVYTIMPKWLQLELRTFKKTRLSIHIRNIQQLLIQICKCLKGLSLPIMSEILVLRNIPYPIRNLRNLDSQLQMNVHRGLEITTCKGSQFWQQLPEK